MRLKIHDTTWKLKCLTPEKFVEILSKDYKNSDAVTDTADKVVYFRKDVINPSVVRHELVHLYYTLAMVSSSDLTMDQTEEVFAELFAKYGEEYYKNSKKVYNWLKKHLPKS